MTSFAACVFTVWLPLLATVSAVFGEEVGAPVFNAGDYWKFEYKMKGGASVSTNLPPGIYTVVFKDGKLSIEGSDFAKVGFDIFSLAVPGLTSHPWYKFPLDVGKSWDFQQKLGGSGVSFVRYLDYNVDKTEKINVGKGTFDAFKLTRMSRQTIKDNTTRSETTYYYSPSTKSAIKAIYAGGSGEIGEINLLEYGNRP